MGTYTAGAGVNYSFNPVEASGFPILNYDSKAFEGDWFGTFCMERSENFTPGQTYNVTLSNSATLGGNSTAPDGVPGTSDPLSKGTVYLYDAFARVALAYNYNSSSAAAELQNMFWYLEGEISLSDLGSNSFVSILNTQFGTLDNARLMNTSPTSVQVMNLTTLAGAPAQSQLVYIPTTSNSVPDGGMTVLLLGISFVGIAAVRRFAFCPAA